MELQGVNSNLRKILKVVSIDDVESISSMEECDRLITLLNKKREFIVDDATNSIYLVVLDNEDSVWDYLSNVNKFYGIYNALPLLRRVLEKSEITKTNNILPLLNSEKNSIDEKIFSIKETYRSNIHEVQEKMPGEWLLEIDSEWDNYNDKLFESMILSAIRVSSDRLIAGYLIKNRTVLNVIERLINDVQKELASLYFKDEGIMIASNYLLEKDILTLENRTRFVSLLEGKSISPHKIQFNRRGNYLSKFFKIMVDNNWINRDHRGDLARLLVNNFEVIKKSEFVPPSYGYIYKGLTCNSLENYKYLSKEEITF